MEGYQLKDGDDYAPSAPPPPYHQVSQILRDRDDERLRQKSENAARRKEIQMKVVIGCICIVVVLALSIIAIELQNLKNASPELKKIQGEVGEQIVIIEGYLEDLKNATQEIQEVKKMQGELREQIEDLKNANLDIQELKKMQGELSEQIVIIENDLEDLKNATPDIHYLILYKMVIVIVINLLKL